MKTEKLGKLYKLENSEEIGKFNKGAETTPLLMRKKE